MTIRGDQSIELVRALFAQQVVGSDELAYTNAQVSIALTRLADMYDAAVAARKEAEARVKEMEAGWTASKEAWVNTHGYCLKKEQFEAMEKRAEGAEQILEELRRGGLDIDAVLLKAKKALAGRRRKHEPKL